MKKKKGILKKAMLGAGLLAAVCGGGLFLWAYHEARQGENRAHHEDGRHGLEPVHAAH